MSRRQIRGFSSPHVQMPWKGSPSPCKTVRVHLVNQHWPFFMVLLLFPRPDEHLAVESSNWTFQAFTTRESLFSKQRRTTQGILYIVSFLDVFGQPQRHQDDIDGYESTERLSGSGGPAGDDRPLRLVASAFKPKWTNNDILADLPRPFFRWTFPPLPPQLGRLPPYFSHFRESKLLYTRRLKWGFPASLFPRSPELLNPRIPPCQGSLQYYAFRRKKCSLKLMHGRGHWWCAAYFGPLCVAY